MLSHGRIDAAVRNQADATGHNAGHEAIKVAV
jgi:hypothetical protein